ncbi:ABC transporter permease [Phycicoccus sp. Soil802]|uniref:ABC transporter permease n=1 Tax=Phycicoccus sp. Soil802 TaxID=1736414 RepID=UPI00138F0197|nr:ABC transporter permease [Phycicoccus sp. Soil802]
MATPLPSDAGTDAGVRSRARPGPRQPLSTAERMLAVFSYFLTVYRRTWRGSIIGRFLSPLFFLLAMGVGLGSLVNDRVGGVDGLPYLQFVVPAIVATQTMWVAMGESTYQVLGYIKWNMGYHAMLASPMSVRDVLRGHFLAVAAHLTTATTIFMGVAALFGGFRSVAAVFCLPIAILTGLAFTTPIFAFTARQEGDDGFNILFRWVVTPLMLFSGTFFPVEQFPGWMQPIAWVTPLWHGVEACRDVATGAVALGPFVGHVAVLAVYVAVGWWLAERSFAARLVP